MVHTHVLGRNPRRDIKRRLVSANRRRIPGFDKTSTLERNFPSWLILPFDCCFVTARDSVRWRCQSNTN
jgi:hypothetical protein